MFQENIFKPKPHLSGRIETKINSEESRGWEEDYLVHYLTNRVIIFPRKFDAINLLKFTKAPHLFKNQEKLA